MSALPHSNQPASNPASNNRLITYNSESTALKCFKWMDGLTYDELFIIKRYLDMQLRDKSWT